MLAPNPNPVMVASDNTGGQHLLTVWHRHSDAPDISKTQRFPGNFRRTDGLPQAMESQ
jgi:hypothetical protein